MSAKQAKTKEVQIDISKLKINRFVREIKDPDYVLLLAELYESGQPMEPIVITTSLEVVDGRNRIEASILACRTTVNAIIVSDMEKKELLVTAMNANMGGSRPPTNKDVIFSIEALLRAGATGKWIVDNTRMPRQVTEKYLFTARRNLMSIQIVKARQAMAERLLTVEEAATEFGVTLPRLKSEITGKRFRDGINIASQLKSGITHRNKSDSQRNTTAFKAAIHAYREGDMTKEQVMAFFDEIEHHGNLSVKAAADFRDRFFQQVTSAV